MHASNAYTVNNAKLSPNQFLICNHENQNTQTVIQSGSVGSHTPLVDVVHSSLYSESLNGRAQCCQSKCSKWGVGICISTVVVSAAVTAYLYLTNHL